MAGSSRSTASPPASAAAVAATTPTCPKSSSVTAPKSRSDGGGVTEAVPNVQKGIYIFVARNTDDDVRDTIPKSRTFAPTESHKPTGEKSYLSTAGRKRPEKANLRFFEKKLRFFGKKVRFSKIAPPTGERKKAYETMADARQKKEGRRLSFTKIDLSNEQDSVLRR